MKKNLLTLSVFLLSINYLLAQIPPPPDNHENTGPGVPTPVDQYIFVLIGLALSIGIYFIWNKKKAFN